ncbi:MAG: SAM-dependent methyltransferase [Anaerolineae bacterium]
MGTLFVVATPLGNLEDIGMRALRVLSEVPLVLAEDTRITRRLLARYDLHPRLRSFHEHTTSAQAAALAGALDDGDAALVSDAGTPGVSDPGVALVQAALRGGHSVVPIPGPSAPAAALSVSGMPADAYTFLGFLPRRSEPRPRCCGRSPRSRSRSCSSRRRTGSRRRWPIWRPSSATAPWRCAAS